ncbi:MAG: alanine--tRNA ligase [Bdellovibrionaceae bacterium]|nr:alanine--tRNA ligase [Pseudobdellovibrionaceae bacterium]
MKSSEIRSLFINYFKKNGHTIVASSSLVPENDPTLLFANAGMNQFKNTFLGLEKRDYNRAVSSQKCVRAGGKHNDLENVGFTARHHTFFEMLGNFSFGDYFKKDAIHFAWEFLTKELKIPKEKLYVTVHLSDDEAADIWHTQEGIPRERIFRFDKDNFWKMGDTGPCGPCTEIFYDHGPKAGKESDPFKGIEAGEDRFVEIWNLVFMQYFENPPGTLTPLPKPSVDTGAGLERIVAAMQGKFNNYDTDLFAPMIERACKIGGFEYVTDVDVLAKNPQARETTAAIRVMADHCRSAGFLIADGALPANEGRGYVLRRIMRRAIRYGHKLNDKHSFLPSLVESMIDHMGTVFPELQNRKAHIISTVKDEETRFMTTLDQGSHILNEEIAKAKSKGLKSLSGEIVFKLYDTFGFPVDLTGLIAAEKGLSVDEGAFEKEMDAARTKARASWKGKGMQADEAHTLKFAQDCRTKNGATIFYGYESMSGQCKVIAISDGAKEVQSLKAGQSGLLVLNKSPFYAEGGGQVGDQGVMKTESSIAQVHNTTKSSDIHLHHVELEDGEIKVGDDVHTSVSESVRRNTMSNHSATHLMHTALRRVLGTHVGQAGSLVDATRTRFDFTHNKSMTAEEILQVEAMVNAEIGKAHEVKAENMKHKEAIDKGAMALFGEKYGDDVRVLSMGDFSSELCGGTHVRNTAQIRMFKVISEGGVSAGVRRIEAVTGDYAVQYAMYGLQQNQQARVAAGLDSAWTHFTSSQSTNGVDQWIETKKNEVRALEKEIKKLQGGQINIEDLASRALTFNSKTGAAKLILADVTLDDRDVLAQVTDHLKNKIQKGIVVVVGHGEGSHPVIVSVSKDISGEFSAGNLLKEVAAVMGGKGGGRPDFAQGAAPDRTKIAEAFKKVQQILGL